MKTKKDNFDCEQAKRRSYSKSNLAFKSQQSGKKKMTKSNKQNFLQITQPLQPHKLSQKSKKTKEISNKKRTSFKQLPSTSQFFHEKPHIKPEKDNYVDADVTRQFFERRLSLKCNNSIQNLQKQHSQRLSMIPEMKINQKNRFSCFGIDQRDSMSSLCQTTKKNEKYKGNYKKDTIINNFVNKLDKEEDLRSIIESKLKSSQPKFQSFNSQFSTSTNNGMRKHQAELQNYKFIIKEMSQKIAFLTTENLKSKNMKKKSKCYDQQSLYNRNSERQQYIYINTDSQICTRKQKSIGVQTESISMKNNKQDSIPTDFYTNLQKTIKVLQKRKNAL